LEVSMDGIARRSSDTSPDDESYRQQLDNSLMVGNDRNSEEEASLRIPTKQS
jgi:hypothetical protein